jgi:hypothetical protein
MNQARLAQLPCRISARNAQLPDSSADSKTAP